MKTVTSIVLGLVLAVSGCTPKKLLKATSSYATLTNEAAAELSAAPGIVTDLCLQRAQLEYLTARVLPRGQQAASFADFYVVTQFAINLAGAAKISWKQHCDAYRVADAAFSKAVASIAEYGAALGAFANEDYDPQEDLEEIAASAASGVAAISETAKPYKSALEGVGKPLGILANAVKTRWKAKRLGALIEKTDPALQKAISQLDDFVGVVRTSQVRDVREALLSLLEQLDNIREAQSPGLAGGQVTIHKLDRITASLFDIEVSARMAQTDRKLRALSEILQNLAAAHAELRKGWKQGEDAAGVETVKAVGKLGKAVYDALQAFRNPAREAP